MNTKPILCRCNEAGQAIYIFPSALDPEYTGEQLYIGVYEDVQGDICARHLTQAEVDRIEDLSKQEPADASE